MAWGPIVRRSTDGEREIVTMSWGFLRLEKGRAPKVLNRRHNVCLSCSDAEADRVRVHYTFKDVEAQSWSDRPPPQSRYKRRQ